MVATYRFVISKRLYLPVFNKRAKKKKKRRCTKQFEQIKHMKIKIQEVTSDVVITDTARYTTDLSGIFR